MGQEPHRATTRALDILEYLADVGGAGSTLTELAAALDAPKSSLFPIVHTLAERRYIRLDRETGRYAVGISAYALGAAYTAGRNRNALRYIQEVMEDIVERWPRLNRALPAYLAVVLALFILFYPVLSGLPISSAYGALLKWMPTWYFTY